MGLFLDDQGIPLSIEEFPGNTLDAQTLKDAMRKTVDNFDMGRFILVADRGMYSGTNVHKVADGEDIGTILRAFGVDVTPQAYTKGELSRLKSSISVF